MEFVPKGVLPAMVTPLNNEGELDEKALGRLIEHLIQGGLHGIFAVGTTGEFYGIDKPAYCRLLEATVAMTAKRVPVHVGANSITTRDGMEMAKMARKAGVDAISVLTPFFISMNQRELYNHFAAIADAAEIPVILYDNSPRTHIHIAPATAEKLADIPNIVGIKDSSGDMTNTTELIRRTRGKKFSVLMGRDTLIYSNLCLGGTGAVAACANVAPRLCADIYDRFVAGDIAGALEAQFRLAPLRLAFSLGSPAAVIKEALAMIGLDVGGCVAPTERFTENERAQLRDVLVGMSLLETEK